MAQMRVVFPIQDIYPAFQFTGITIVTAQRYDVFIGVPVVISEIEVERLKRLTHSIDIFYLFVHQINSMVSIEDIAPSIGDTIDYDGSCF
ncbi:MAG: hypothetical protein CMC22_02065 [Flavobacteriaceae bacterium]|nr:hypothetical protein [Flavobacteriaceae bacterium]